MNKETANRIDYWTEEIVRLEKEIAETDADADLYIALHEAKEQLNFAWQDDVLEEMGLR